LAITVNYGIREKKEITSLLQVTSKEGVIRAYDG
jgi:hypothetical protein